MTTALVLSLLLQQLAVQPYPAEVGAPVVVSASSPTGPVAGLALTLEFADGAAQPVGTTDSAGRVAFAAPVAGLHRVVAECEGVRIVAPFHVVPVPPRWLYALVCVPLGLALLVRNLRARPQPVRQD